jgi:hypothetical protein
MAAADPETLRKRVGAAFLAGLGLACAIVAALLLMPAATSIRIPQHPHVAGAIIEFGLTELAALGLCVVALRKAPTFVVVGVAILTLLLVLLSAASVMEAPIERAHL